MRKYLTLHEDVALRIFIGQVTTDEIRNLVALDFSFELAHLFLKKCNATDATDATSRPPMGVAL